MAVIPSDMASGLSLFVRIVEEEEEHWPSLKGNRPPEKIRRITTQTNPKNYQKVII